MRAIFKLNASNVTVGLNLRCWTIQHATTTQITPLHMHSTCPCVNSKLRCSLMCFCHLGYSGEAESFLLSSDFKLKILLAIGLFHWILIFPAILSNLLWSRIGIILPLSKVPRCQKQTEEEREDQSLNLAEGGSSTASSDLAFMHRKYM